MSIESEKFGPTNLSGGDAKEMADRLSDPVTNPLAKIALAKARIRRGDLGQDYAIVGDTPEERRAELDRIIKTTRSVAKKSSEETDQRLREFVKGRE